MLLKALGTEMPSLQIALERKRVSGMTNLVPPIHLPLFPLEDGGGSLGTRLWGGLNVTSRLSLLQF